MIEQYHDLSGWVVGFAESDWAILLLALSSFAEAIFFPIPPDPLLVGIAIAQPEIAIWLGVLTAAASVAGAVVGHWLGKRLGRPLLLRWFSESKVYRVELMFQRYGVWATLIAAFTPIPYKVFAIAAGAMEMDRKGFVVASAVGRGVRFITLGALVMIFGESIKDLVGQNFELITVAVIALALGAVGAWLLWDRKRRGRRMAQR
jgi:membrane protein YqaA with SNARE-associated domain